LLRDLLDLHAEADDKIGCGVEAFVIERRPAPPDRTKALAENQIAALWRLDVALRPRTTPTGDKKRW
jgi:hypothetical protein